MSDTAQIGGPLDGLKALAAMFRRVDASPSYAGYDDADYLEMKTVLAGEGARERAETTAMCQDDLRALAEAIEKPEDLERVQGLIATLPEDLAAWLGLVILAQGRGAERSGAPGLLETHALAEGERKVAFEQTYGQHRDELAAQAKRLAGPAVVGVIEIPGLTWLLGMGVHVARALAYLLFWLLDKVRLGRAIIVWPIWILAAAFDLIVVNLPFLAFQLVAWLVRGQRPTARAHDRELGAWAFSRSLLARKEYAALWRHTRHRELVRESYLAATAALYGMRLASSAEVAGKLPAPPPPAKGAVPLGTRIAWWSPWAAPVACLGVLALLFSGSDRDGGRVASAHRERSAVGFQVAQGETGRLRHQREVEVAGLRGLEPPPERVPEPMKLAAPEPPPEPRPEPVAPPADPCDAARDPATGAPLTKAIEALRVRPPLPADGAAFQAGVDAAEAALQVAPECSDAWASLAFASYRRHYDVCGRGDYARATEAVDKAIALAATPAARSAALRNKGRIHAARLEWDQALAAFTTARTEAPENKEAQAWLDDLGVRATPRAEVIALVRRVLASEPIAKEELEGFTGAELGFAANAALAKYGRRLNAAPVDWFYYCDDSPLAPHPPMDPSAKSAPVPKGSIDQANQRLLDATARERSVTP